MICSFGNPFGVIPGADEAVGRRPTATAHLCCIYSQKCAPLTQGPWCSFEEGGAWLCSADEDMGSGRGFLSSPG